MDLIDVHCVGVTGWFIELPLLLTLVTVASVTPATLFVASIFEASLEVATRDVIGDGLRVPFRDGSEFWFGFEAFYKDLFV